MPNPKSFNDQTDIKLIRLVKENPVLYDNSYGKYMDFNSREVAWQKIGDELRRSALKFAGLQCQIQHGDHDEEIHKPGLIENDKQYSVQTHDADRICDILRGYIDLISKKKAASPYNVTAVDGGVLTEENVEFSRGNEITVVSHDKSKDVEESFIGSSKLISYEPGQSVQQGTQIMTVQQVLVTNKGSTEQKVVSGEIPIRKDMSLEFIRKLNKMNSNSVKIVSLLNNPSKANISEAQNIIGQMEMLMPDIRIGVKETAEKQTSEQESKNLLQQLQELDQFLQSLSQAAQNDDRSLEEIEEAAKQIADLSTQMYFSLDPRTKRRSDLVRSSRKSFIQDERVEASLKRASLIAAAGQATKSIDGAKELLLIEYHGLALDMSEVQNVEAAAVNKLGQINAAVAIYLSAYADPTNVDYSAAVTSMNAIHELVPELAIDAQVLSSLRDGKSKKEFLEQITNMCEALRLVSMLTGVDDHKKMQETATEFADASGKLIYTLGRATPKLSADKENEIMDLTTDACNITTLLLVKANTLTELCQSDPAAVDVDSAGVQCANAAADLVLTAQLTSPTIFEPHCRSALTASAETLSSSSAKLAHAWRPLAQAHAQRLGQSETSAHLVEELESFAKQLDQALEKLKQSYAGFEDTQNAENGVEQSPERIRFIISINKARDSVKEAEQELDAPMPQEKPDVLQAKEIEKTIAERVAQVNAAVASLVQARSDPDGPNQATIELALNTISEVMPDLTRETKQMSSTYNDDDSRKAILEDVRTWCRAIDSVCSGLDGDGKTLDESLDTFANASQKLSFVFSPRANRAKEQLLLELSEMAHSRALQMASACDKMADMLGGQSGHRLSTYGPRLETQAHALKKSVQLTALTVGSPRCQSVVTSAVDSVAETSQQIVSETRGLRDDETGCSILAEKLDSQKKRIEDDAVLLEKDLEGIKDVCFYGAEPPEPTKRPPPLPEKKSTLTRVNKPAVQSATDSTQNEQNYAAPNIVKSNLKQEQEEFLKKEREHERMTKKGVEEEQTETLRKLVKDAEKLLKSAESDLKKQAHTSKLKPPLNPAETKAMCTQIEDQLARASAAASKLLAARNSETKEYGKASSAVQILSEFVPLIVKDGVLLSNDAEENTRKTILGELQSLCKSTGTLCNAFLSDAKEVNEAAVKFGDSGARLRFLISPTFDPQKEREVISRAKTIGEAASRLAQGTAQLQVEDLSPRVGQQAVDMASAASTLLYTAKLVAPSIQHPECRETLAKASQDLFSHLRTLSTNLENPDNLQKSDTLENSKNLQTRENLKNSQLQTVELTQQAKNLENLIEDFQRDIAEGKMVVLKEQVVVDENGLRKLTSRILEHAKQMSETSTQPNAKVAYAQYANKLTDDIKVLDLANHNCRNAKELNKYKQVEGAVQQLQVSVLQRSPALRGKPQSNIIDLTDFTKSVSTELKELLDIAHKANVPVTNRPLAEIKQLCHRLSVAAFKITNPSSNRVDSDDALGDIMEVDQFAQDCEREIEAIEARIQSLDDEKTKKALQQKVMTLKESCNLLRFASKSALSTAQSVALDETLNDLEELENKIDSLVLRGKDDNRILMGLHLALRDEAKMSLQSAAVALCRGKALDLSDAVTKYAIQCRGKDGAKDHLSEVLRLLILCCAAASSRVAVWEPPFDTVKPLVQKVVEELNRFSEADKSDAKNPQVKIISEADAMRLLSPIDNTKKFEGDEKQLEAGLLKSANKLSSLASTILASASKPESLSRTVRGTVEATLQLVQLANASESRDPIRSEAVLEKSQVMCFASYKLLKTAEALCQDPSNADHKRKLLEACKCLNDLIDDLVRKASTAEKLHKGCNELQRRLQTQQNGLQMSQPGSAMSYSDCLDTINAHEEIFNTVNSEELMTREEFAKSLNEVVANVSNTVQFAAHCGYLLSISEKNKDLAQGGLIDTARIQKLLGAAEESCLKILRATQLEQMKYEDQNMKVHLEHLKEALNEALSRVEGDSSVELVACMSEIDEAAKAVRDLLKSGSVEVDAPAFALLDTISAVRARIEKAIPAPSCEKLSDETKVMMEEITGHCKNLLSKTQKLVKDVNATDDCEPMTWVTYGTSRKDVLEAFQRLANSLRKNGQRAGLIADEKSEDVDEEVEQKSFVQMQVAIVSKWLQKKPLRPEIQKNGEKSVWILIELAKQLREDLPDQEQKELNHLITDCEQLIAECSKKYDQEKATTLLDRVREVSKTIEQGAVTKVVEDFADAEAPLEDLDTLVDSEIDETKRKFLLEQKIAELLAQLGKVTRTARFVAAASVTSPAASEQLKKCSEQVELIAPQLVKAAQARVKCPQDVAAIEHYRALLAQYTESLAKVRDLCDANVDPMDFVQAAGETMQRMRETPQNDPQKCVFTSIALQRLANRVIVVGLSSPRVQKEPELQKALKEAQDRLKTAPPTRVSKVRDWKDNADEILRTTGEVESALGGEMIFKRQPEPDQPIYTAAHGLHKAVREWSARDNELVAVAKRVAVLMARLAGYVDSDAKRELVSTSKNIVSESHEVARLARKLAVECTDVRIRTNLLQVCERIPTISGQLRMLTTVKSSSFGCQGTDEDKEAMNMLICNARNLMFSVQEVVSAAASASVKIRSQRGPRVRWVRRQYY